MFVHRWLDQAWSTGIQQGRGIGDAGTTRLDFAERPLVLWWPQPACRGIVPTIEGDPSPTCFSMSRQLMGAGCNRRDRELATNEPKAE